MAAMITIANANALYIPLPDQSVQCIVTSPPYYGLRDYGTAKWEGGSAECDHVSGFSRTDGDRETPGGRGGSFSAPVEQYRNICARCGARRIDAQIGLESTPAAYVASIVAVMRECWRVLKDDGVMWLNLGDSYTREGGGTANVSRHWDGRENDPGGLHNIKPLASDLGMNAKNLIGIPWRVAFALQQPYYTGRIQNEIDRVWLAAMLDAEGCITASQYETGERLKSNIYISITNSSTLIIDKCEHLFSQDMKHIYEKGGAVNKTVYRWDVERIENKSIFLREIYPYLVAKRKQAILGYTFLELQKGLASKKKGYLPEQQGQRTWIIDSLSRLNNGVDVDIPDWAVEPPPCTEPGFYLRQDIIWHKPNPMPESVTDRCTKAHEYIFLLAKRARYYYDAEAISEPAIYAGDDRGSRTDSRRDVPMANSMNSKTGETRNRRSVWTVATSPYSGAHFATFPPALIEPMILAGSRRGDVILDPFAGSGTTGAVAVKHSRRAVLLDLNTKYIDLQFERTNGVQMQIPI